MTERIQEFDLHGHTKNGLFPEFVPYDVEDVLLKAKEVGLDGVAITEHDTVRSLDRALNKAQKHGIIVVPGIEITSWEGRRFPHVLALGITPGRLKKDRIPTGRDPETVMKWVHDHGGVAIAAHPKENGGLTSLSYSEIERLHDHLDGIETVTTFGVNDEAKRLAGAHSLSDLGSSDFHMLEQIGLVGTKSYTSCYHWQDVISAIRNNNVTGFVRTDIPSYLVGRRSPKILLDQIMSRRG